MPIKHLNTQQAMRYNRHISLGNFDVDKQELLLNANVLIVGAGGLGCAASQYLVASGIGNITLADDDVVESSNLQRQVLHSDATVGQQKVMSAKAALEQLNADTSITAVAQKVTDKNVNPLISKVDVVLDCSDNLVTRKLLNSACYGHTIPLVSGAAIRMEGQVFCVLPDENSACYGCFSHQFGEQALSCVEAGVLSPLVGVIGAMQALEAIKILTNYGESPINRLQVYDAMVSRWTSFRVNKLPACSICG